MAEPQVLFMQPFPLQTSSSPPLSVPAGDHLRLLLKLSAGLPPVLDPWTLHLDKESSKLVTKPISLFPCCFCLWLLSLITALKGEKKGRIILSLGHLSTKGLSSTISSSSNIYGSPNIHRTSCLKQGISTHFL